MQMIHRIASLSKAIENCRKEDNTWWEGKHTSTLNQILGGLPSGAGIDAGSILKKVEKNRVVFATSYHHMNDAGCYTGWTDHEIIVRPSFSLCCGFTLKVTGKNKNCVKEAIEEAFYDYLSKETQL